MANLGTLEAVITADDAEFKAAMESLAKAGQKASQALARSFERVNSRNLEQGLHRTSVKTRLLNGEMRGLGATLRMQVIPYMGMLVGAMGTNKLVQYANSWSNTNNLLKQVTGSSAELLNVQNQLADSAHRARSDYSAMADLYSNVKMAAVANDVKYANEQVVKFTELVGKGMAAGGADSQSQANAIRQLVQGLSSNKLGGEEYRALREYASPMLNKIAEAMGMTLGELGELSRQGELDMKSFVDATLAAEKEIEASFSKTTGNIGTAAAQMHSALTVAIGRIDSELGASRGTAEWLEGIAEGIKDIDPRTIEKVADALKIATIAIGTYAATGLTQNLLARTKTLKALLTETTQVALADKQAAAAALQKAQADKQAAIYNQKAANAAHQQAQAMAKQARTTEQLKTAKQRLAQTSRELAVANRAVTQTAAQATIANNALGKATKAATLRIRLMNQALMVFGGWPGLIATAVGVASMALFSLGKDSETLSDKLDLASLSVEQLKDKLEELNAVEVNRLKFELEDDLHDGKKQLIMSINKLREDLERSLGKNLGKGVFQLDDRGREVLGLAQKGQLDEAQAALDALKNQGNITQRVYEKLTNSLGPVSDNLKNISSHTEKLNALNGVEAQLTQEEKDEKRNAALDEALKRKEDMLNLARMSREEQEVYNIAKQIQKDLEKEITDEQAKQMAQEVYDTKELQKNIEELEKLANMQFPLKEPIEQVEDLSKALIETNGDVEAFMQALKTVDEQNADLFGGITASLSDTDQALITTVTNTDFLNKVLSESDSAVIQKALAGVDLSAGNATARLLGLLDVIKNAMSISMGNIDVGTLEGVEEYNRNLKTIEAIDKLQDSRKEISSDSIKKPSRGGGKKKGGGGKSKKSQEDKDIEKTLKDLQSPLEEYNEKLESLNKAKAKGKITTEQYDEAMKRLGRDMVGAGSTVNEVKGEMKLLDEMLANGTISWEEYSEKTISAMTNLPGVMGDLASEMKTLSEGFSDAFADMIVDAESFSEGFSNVLKSMAKNLISTAMTTLSNQAVTQFMGMLSGSGGLGGGLMGSIGGLLGFADGGKVQKYATGGFVSGSGTSRSDSIPAMLSNGEYVVNAKATKAYAPLLQAINQGSLEDLIYRAKGGFANVMNTTNAVTKAASSGKLAQGRGGSVNLGGITTGDTHITIQSSGDAEVDQKAIAEAQKQFQKNNEKQIEITFLKLMNKYKM